MTKNNIKGMIFDLDGTLVTSDIDFGYLKQQIGCPNHADILAYINQLTDPAEQQAAQTLVVQMELEDALASQWIPGAQAFLAQLLEHDIPMAIVTRNCRAASSMKIAHHDIPIKLVLTREDAVSKPDPEALNIIAQQWGFEPNEIAYVGDYIYDIQAANRAKMHAWSYRYLVPAGETGHIDRYFECYTELDVKQLTMVD